MSEPASSIAPPLRVIALRYPATCGCGAELTASSLASWDAASRTVTCVKCPSDDLLSAGAAAASMLPGGVSAPAVGVSLPEPFVGEPGASLQREYERRARTRAAKVKAEHRILGGLILALTDEPKTTKSFRTGADGERRAAAKVVRRASSDALFLFNRSLGVGRRDGDIDMLAVGPAGVFVVDVKCYPGAQVEVRHSGPRRSQRAHLMIRRREQPDLLESVGRQVAVVREALSAHPYSADVPVSGALCFLDAHLPVMTAHVSGVPLLNVRSTAELVSSAGVLDAADRATIHAVLAERLPAAT